MDAYPNAFVAAINKTCNVAEVICWSGRELSWNMEACMDVNDPSFQLVRDDLLGELSEVPLCSDVDNGYEWRMSGEDCFSVHFCYELFLSVASAGTVCQEETMKVLVSL